MPSLPNSLSNVEHGWLRPILNSPNWGRYCRCTLYRATRNRALRSHRVLPAQRQEVLCALDGLGNFAQQLLQVFIAIDEINVRGVDNQQVRRRVVKKEMLVGFDYFR